ncbi:short-chain dehydrogenase [Corynespora cassiicola Philippines]|uniref:Short-chain dehydrogenase n=1 Tax=Corynespora cassiicola Philippines TaxID=1448308 RepID=A0A2T2NAJ5_CORCC|nr:short-chain dehydrogenase [Corynespora cassiicola Philippines]
MSSPLPYNRQNATASGIAADNASQIAGKIVLTTGVSPGGLGAAFVEYISKHKPALLILAGRSPAKLQATADKIASNPDSADVETRLLSLDLASQEQIREAAKEVLTYPEDHIDVVVNSAGLMAGPHAKTKEGIELQFGGNHIGHFLFTNLIMPKVLASKSPRVVNVSSSGHRLGPVRFEDWNFQDGKVYKQWEAYGQSKAANILYSKALAQKLGSKGLRAYSLHPGVFFGTGLSPDIQQADFDEFKARDIEIGALKDGEEVTFDVKDIDSFTSTNVVAAFDPRLDGHNGAYLEDANIAEPWPTATSLEDAEKLWKLSEKLVGQTFDF